MTGVSRLRSRAAKTVSDTTACRRASAKLGSDAPGVVPPPTTLSVSITSVATSNDDSAFAIMAQRFLMSSEDARIIAIDAAYLPSRSDRAAAWPGAQRNQAYRCAL